MKTLKILSFALITLLILNSCATDEDVPDSAAFKVDILLSGNNPEAFGWTLSLATDDVFSGFNEGDSFSTGSLAFDETHTFSTINHESIQLAMTFSSLPPKGEEINDMTVLIIVTRDDRVDFNQEAIFEEIGTFSRSYVLDSSSERLSASFRISATYNGEGIVLECESTDRTEDTCFLDFN